ncbi:MAG: efflux RND transporter periplasmic adaptor subunit [Flavipsychrobacter sp.]|nr:efflux RND transporter periplasmic adaptor subunit [Flavipsychrobacter sp.]
MTASTERSKRRIWIGGGLIVAIALIGFLTMTIRQKNALSAETDRRQTEKKNGPVVKAVTAGNTADDKGNVYIGEARPFQSITLYAKTSGYMNKILVDKGDKVREGQLLATIVTPEIDQSYEAALADLNNKRKISERDQKLVQKEYISKEDAEATETAVKVAEAQVRSLREQQQYKNLVAPFAGTITARYADAGALVQNATNSQTSAQPVVTLSQLDKIRIYIYVPQADAESLRENYPVTITMSERPDVKISATITRISGELDAKTRMELVEIDLPNRDNQIIPGSYVQVTLQAPKSDKLTLPSSALVVRGSKYFVAVIDKDSTLHYRPIVAGNNDGVHMAIVSGVEIGDVVAVNVGDNLTEGEKVRVQQSK